MSEQAEVIKILENIRTQRDLGAFVVEPKKTRKQRESAQTGATVSVTNVTPLTMPSDSEKDKIKDTPLPISVIESRLNTEILKPVEKASPKEVTKKVKTNPTPNTKNILNHDGSVTELDFLQLLSMANDDISLDHSKRIYLNKDIFHKLSLLKIAGNVRNVSHLVNAILAQFLKENDSTIDHLLKDLTT